MNYKDFIILMIFVLLSCTATFFILEKSAYTKGYIDACEDFCNGKLKYDFEKKADGTRVWKRIK